MMRRGRGRRYDFDCEDEGLEWGARSPSLSQRCVRSARTTLRCATVIGLLALFAVGLLALRLAQGPLAIPGVAGLIEAQVNGRIDTATVSIGDAVLSVGQGDEPSGLLFRNVSARAPDGRLLLSAPKVLANFHLGDLARGRVQPTRLVMVGPRARILRLEDGRVLFGLGREAAPRPLPRGAARRAGEDLADPAEAVARTIRGFVGDEAPVPVLEKLERIAVLNAEIDYSDARTGQRWRTRGSDLRLFRTGDGAQAVMRAAIDAAGRVPTRIRIEAERKAGKGQTMFTARVRDARPDAIASEIGALGWLAGLAAPVSGRLSWALGEDGGISGLNAQLQAGQGTLAVGLPEPIRLERTELVLDELAEGRGYRLKELVVAGPDVSAQLTGTIRPDPEVPMNVEVDLQLIGLDIDLPTVFQNRVAFPTGQISLRADLEARRLDIANIHLAADPFSLAFTGRLALGEAGVFGGVRARGANLTVARLKDLWPLIAAPNPREWVTENLIEGRIPELVAQVGLGPGQPIDVALDFAFEDVASRYLGDMPPIAAGFGSAHMGRDRFDLHLASGQVTPQGGQAIDILPSDLTIGALEGDVQPADIALRTRGRIDDVLALIDHAPLRLMSKLGVPLGPVGGRTEVSAVLAFPLLNALKVEEIEVAAEATLRDVSLEVPARDGQTIPVRSERLALQANPERLTLAGGADAKGVPLEVRWEEYYGEGPGARSLTLAGRITPELLAANGISPPLLRSGEIPFELEIDAQGAAGRLSLAADLTPAGLGLAAADWTKPAGTPGRFEAEGALGNGLSLERLSFVGGGLTIEGTARLGEDGALLSAEFPRVALADRAELGGRIERSADGDYAISLAGPFLDLSAVLTDPPSTEPAVGGPSGSSQTTEPTGPAVSLDARIDRLVLTPKLSLSPVSGRFRRAGSGQLTLSMSGQAGEGAPFEAAYRSDPGHEARVRVNAADAGALLANTGLFEGASGGTLTLDAALAPSDGTGGTGGESDARGTARIEGLAVRQARTFGSILERGGVEEAAEAVATEGIVFSSIDIPFTYTDGVILLQNAIARSPVVALKVEGEVEEAANRLDLRGVLSPAYAITGALDNVPVLGRLLSGGEGEGILAMTFRVGGSLDDPDFSVNPLSLLAPGFLRNVFTGDAGPPADGFADRIERDEAAR